jgi:small subunit ribosomal protein S20
VANHESALKAHKQSVANRDRNRQARTRLRSSLKAIRKAITAKDADGAKASLNETVSLIDKMAKKGVIHDNAASRYKSRLARRLNGLAAA